jgi:hypothetical protein
MGGGSPAICCALVSCFSSRPIEVPGPVSRNACAKGNTGKFWGFAYRSIPLSIVRTLQSREEDERERQQSRTYTQYVCKGLQVCGREERVPEHTIILLSV